MVGQAQIVAEPDDDGGSRVQRGSPVMAFLIRNDGALVSRETMGLPVGLVRPKPPIGDDVVSGMGAARLED